MNIILINTTTPHAYVALAAGKRVVAERTWPADATLGQKLLAAIDELLTQAGIAVADVQRIAVHEGPGHFGALRTAITTATMLAHTTGAELVGLQATTGAAMAAEADHAEPVTQLTPRYATRGY